MNYKRYLVTGDRQYRSHDPGTVFDANLDPDAERRAVERGAIRVLAEITVEVGVHDLPEDWPHKPADAQPTGSPIGDSRAN